jgi:hypothetical protein
MRRALRVAGCITLIVGAIVTLAAASVATLAFWRTPLLVADLERSGVLPLDPATLPPTRICALPSVQDRTFFRHHGIGLLDGPPLHTTVTQSICKGLFFRRFSPGPLRYRKLMLMVYAWAFDLRVPKQTQLRIFMNRAFLGNKNGTEALGFDGAAKAYFGRGIRDIGDREYLALVRMLLAPNTYHVVDEPGASSRRVQSVEPLVAAVCSPPCLRVPPHAPCGEANR